MIKEAINTLESCNTFLGKNYDYAYFLMVQRDKLQRMIKLFIKNDWHTTTQHDVENIEKAVVLLDRLIEDAYPLLYPWDEAANQKQRDLDAYLTILSAELFNWWD